MAQHYRYGFYLRPDLAMGRAVAEMHRLLKAQYNLITAGLFMPHTTLKGFYRSDAPPEEMIARLHETMAGWQAFTVFNNGVFRFGPRSIVIGVRNLPDGSPNTALYELQERAWSALESLIHPDCDFTSTDPRWLEGPNPFHPHISLVQGDLRPELQDEVIEFIEQGGGVGPPHFIADTCHLYRFEADWERGWHRTLTWELLHSWRAM